MKLFITIILFALNLLFNVTSTSAKHSNQKKSIENINQLPCYAVSDDNGSPNVLFEYSPATNSWEQIGITGTSFIEALEIDPINEIIFATDADTFGTIDENTGIFSPISAIGTGNGEFGEVDLDDIDGLTYDPSNFILYATHSVAGTGPSTNDLLFQIDVATGKVVKNAMQDSSGNPADYAVIQAEFEPAGIAVYNVEDIAWDPYSQLLFALHQENSFNIITTLDPYTGQIEQVVRDLAEETMGGMTMTSFGKLLLTTQSEAGEFCILDGLSNFFLPVVTIENPFCFGEISDQRIEAIDCLAAYNDLALTMELDPSIQEPVSAGSEITFLITVYNQGELDNVDITLINYAPDGLTLSDPNWIDIGNGNAITTTNNLLPTFASLTVPITLTVNANYEHTFINAAEIVSSFSYDIVDANGNPLPLPDIDSFPDDIKYNDNDCPFCDPDIGIEPIVYEDDYAFVTVNVEQTDNLPILLSNIQPESCYALGSATVQMLLGGVPPFTHQWENIAGEMVHNQSSSNQQYQVPNLKAGGYYVTIKDAANKINTFATLIPFMAPLSGSTNCNNTCPEYVVVPNGSTSGNFLAEQVVEIKGYVKKTNNALFDICLQ